MLMNGFVLALALTIHGLVGGTQVVSEHYDVVEIVTVKLDDPDSDKLRFWRHSRNLGWVCMAVVHTSHHPDIQWSFDGEHRFVTFMDFHWVNSERVEFQRHINTDAVEPLTAVGCTNCRTGWRLPFVRLIRVRRMGGAHGFRGRGRWWCVLYRGVRCPRAQECTSIPTCFKRCGIIPAPPDPSEVWLVTPFASRLR